MTSTNPESILTTDFTIQFWGVRGQIATPGTETLRYGGNTPCLEMQVGGKRLIFDGGTGLRKLGNHLLAQMPLEAHIFFTHCHWDRIQGFPFFVPAFIPGNHFHIYGGETANGSSFQHRLDRQMLGPNFPVPMQVMQSKLEFHHLELGAKTDLGNGIIVENNMLNYAHRSLGYRVNYQDLAVIYATDIDNQENFFTENLLALAKNANLLILDVPTPEHLNSLNDQLTLWHKNLAILAQVNVKKIVIFPHHPEHNDQRLQELESKLKSDFPNLTLAREDMLISVV